MASFLFRKFVLEHDRSTMKIGTDAVLLAALTDVRDVRSLLDIGCGCGVVAFCVAQKMARQGVSAHIYGVDADAGSVAEAQHNANLYPLLPAGSFQFVHGRIQDFARMDVAPKFDLIVSNPPFYHRDLKPTEPSRLKSRHGDGQLTFEELVACVRELLCETGRFVLILPTMEGEAFDAVARAAGLCCSARTFVRPTAKKPAHRVVQEYGWQPSKCKEHTLTIRDERNYYTDEYLALVKPYLLLTPKV
ncbi:MAG: methyltransferase [Bacteroidales bacterium]|nr:methyltransferase [Bacteroidales bacterium]